MHVESQTNRCEDRIPAVSKLSLIDLQKYLPARVKYTLKPFYRRIFPNRLVAILNPTWRCNYRCSYCPIVTNFAYTSVVPKSDERSGEDWIQALENLPPAAIYIAGGEPFVYADLPFLINNLPERHSLIGIVSNFSSPASVYRKIHKRIHLNASFHREHTNSDEFLAKIKELAPHFHIQVNIVATPENLPLLGQISDELARSEVALHVDPYVDVHFQYSTDQLKALQPYLAHDRNPETQLNFDDFSQKRCSAGRNYVSFSPDGSAYTCYAGMNFIHSTLYSEIAKGKDLSQYRMRNIFDPGFKMNATDSVCSMPCNLACDRDSAIIRPESLTRR